MSYTFDNLLTRSIEYNLTTNRIVPALIGEAGIGKTSFIEDLGKKMNAQVYVIQINQLAEKGDLNGVKTLANPDGSYSQHFFPHHTIAECIDYATQHPDETVILYLDEFNRADQDLTSAAMTLATARTIGTTKLPENIRLIASGNDRGAVNELDSASTSRFVIYDVVPSASTFISILDDSLNPWVRTTLNVHPDLILCYPTDGDDMTMNFDEAVTFTQFTTPRTLEALSQWLNAASRDFLEECLNTTAVNPDETTDNPTNMLYSFIASHIGTTEFSHHLYNTIIDDLNSTSKTMANTSTTAMAATEKPEHFDMLIDPNFQNVNDINNAVLKAQDMYGDEFLNDALTYLLSNNDSIDGYNSSFVGISLLRSIIATGITLNNESKNTIIRYAQFNNLDPTVTNFIESLINGNAPTTANDELIEFFRTNSTLLY